MYEQTIDGKDLVEEFYEDTLIQTSVSVGTNMCYGNFTQVTYPLYYISEPYSFYDEAGLCYVPGSQIYHAMDWGGYDTLIKMFHSFINLN